MKVSNGFISNSSSSSFIISGHPVKFDEIDPKDGVIWISDREMNDGEDLVNITPEIFEKMLESPDKFRFEGKYIKNSNWVDDDSDQEFVVTEQDLHKVIFHISVDYNSTRSDLDDFKRRYLDED